MLKYLNLINLHIKVLILGKKIYLRNLTMVDFLTELVHFSKKKKVKTLCMYCTICFFSIFSLLKFTVFVIDR